MTTSLTSSSSVPLPEQVQRLSGAPNFRDFGGYDTVDGRRVRRGQLFRSDDLSNLTHGDLEALTPLAIRLICDLRGSLERTRRPSRWPEGLTTERIVASLSTDLRMGHGFHARFLEDAPTAENARLMMLETYRYLPRNGARGLQTIFSRLAAGEVPALIHCTAGKDRTGFICASLLSVLGVPRETIYADYLLTNERGNLDALAIRVAPLIEQMLEIKDPLPRVALDVVNGVAREYLDASFAAIDEEHGSLDAYLDTAGVDATMREALRGQLLEPLRLS